MRYLIFTALLIVNFSIISYAQLDKDPVDYVNPLMGSLSTYSLSSGNTYPSASMPWGMNSWTPQTAKMGDGWQYYYNADKIRGFKQTHQPSPWINDYGQFSIMPVTGTLKFREKDRMSWFSHKAEVSKPYYYSVYLADYDVTTELSPTERACSFQFTFPKNDESYIVVDAFNKGSYVKILPGQKKIIGYTTRNSGGVPSNFKNYFVIKFDKAFELSYTFQDSVLIKDKLELTSDHSGAIIGFKTKRGEIVHAKVASSFISFEQAELNLSRELGDDDFNTTKNKGRAIWNKELSRILVEGGSDEETKTFYSCLYRTMLFPRKLHEINANNQTVHYSPYNGEVLPGFMYTDNGFWDTFRAVFPFFNLMYPEVNSEIMQAMVNVYKESGWLPEWQSPGHRNCMIGSNSASIISDAYIKGVRGFDVNVLYEAMLKNSNNAGPMESVGRAGVKEYNELGYVPYDIGVNENAARTLEYAYDDFTIAQLAKALKKPEEEIAVFTQRAHNYKNVFDPSTKLMRGRNKDGEFQSPFNPFKWGDAFTEGNSWHYTWSVFQDVNGLAMAMGGRDTMAMMLDSVFKMPPIFDDSYYGGTIHEIREMQIMNMGQYAHGNQPIQHMIYLYNYAGQPWKAQYWLHQVMNRMYHSGPDGYCGDEDNGQTSAWYVFSAMGFYPVTPGTTQYVIGSPLFKRITISLSNGKKVQINAPAVNSENVYIDNITMDGRPYEKLYFEHFDLLKGGKYDFNMSKVPTTNRIYKEVMFPFSMTKWPEVKRK
ncbi:MAG: GH92 family glycosyl hydrolase [Saprospiraceae bacterium]|nr:GH92 family glycosyl hydrolase [Candidatus Brachybacter algidus]MBL0120436.1 GH92 family glycosyl hydrolase [Candidatus Brachybacter algidus]